MANLEEIDKQLKEMGVTKSDDDAPTLKDAAMFGAEFIPGVGEAMAIKRTSDALDEGDYLGAGIEATAGLLGLVPMVGDVAGKGLRVATKSFRKQDVADAEELLGNAEKLEQWRKSNKLPESQRQKNIPEAEQAAEDLFQNKIKSKEARQKIKEVFPEPKLYTAETMPEMPTVTDVVGAMGKKSEKGILGVKGFDLEPGQRVGARLDIPAYNEYDKWVVSIHDGNSAKGSVVGYGQAIRLKNITFGSDPKVALDIARRKVIKEADPVKGTPEKRMGKATIARVFGDYVPEDPYELQEFAKKVLADKDSGWTQVGMNPYRGSYFYDKATGTPVTRADEVIQVGPLVLAKNVTKPKMSELKEMFKPAARTAEGKLRVFNEGGAVMDKQMDMFDDGGLMQEGGTVDPESGNDVPVGSTQEEVRDDIPAQLSEGEFVFPADVVRYWGLDTLMKMRQQAKMGLKLMEEMGQMGNSEEATIPDDMPFDINDLDMEDDGVLEYNVGGFVPQQQSGISGFQQSQFAGYQPQYQQYQPVTPQTPYTPVLPQQVPVMPQMQSIPTFTDLTDIAQPEPGGYDEMKTYVNDAGMEMQIPFKGGNPIYPIPEGYKLKGEAVETAQTTTTTGTGVETSLPSDNGGGEDEQPGPTTGAVVSVGGEAYGPEEGGGIPGIAPGPSRRVRGATQFGLEVVKEGGIGQDFPVPGIITGVLSAATGTAVGYNYIDQQTGNKVFQTEEQHKANKEGLGKGGVPEVVTLAAEINRVATDEFKDKIESAISQEVTKGQGKVSKSQARDIIRNQLMEANGVDPKVGKNMSDAQIVAQGNINKAKEEASRYGISTSGKSIDEIRQETELEKQRVAERAAAAAAEARRQAERVYDDDSDDSSSSLARDIQESYESEAYGGGFSGFAEGGLVEQMEKSGLTPKK